MFTQGDRCTLLADASGQHVVKFGHFKAFLAGNRNALRALAELETLYYSGQSFTLADIACTYEQLFGEVRSLVQARARRGLATVLTPHPLEAARLLAGSTTEVQANRLDAAQQLARRFACTVVLKGSGTLIAQADATPVINPTGNARLATGGTGDVLAGLPLMPLARPSTSTVEWQTIGHQTRR